ncbi:MAG TPA: transporter substrate-binding domain-containing protein [Noviherbaspirillum sp.]|uniref:substrate-binding periplasmic protein n=1 Tax=Noviherbaspirillum sp. TaxID=1926288 RepID=UPI002B489B03|nr:transporter substrate-binding domain-containing protein [Noviherbaspirillum sp.]HJV85055.1 transporter substrate-binding domain-containing protein [Noviherbaspirillum sp.]
MIMHVLRRLAAPFALAFTLYAPLQQAHADLDKLKQGGILKVAVYNDFAPFSNKESGIDVDFARALADKLGLKLHLLPFDAGEDLGDDLRNMVWKGHYLGYGPADVLMHVPVDPHLMNANKQVKIFAPYYHEKVRLVRDVRKIPTYESVDSLAGKKVGVEKVSISAMVMLGEQDGKFRDNVKIFPTAIEALEKLKAGELDAVLANQSEIESVIRQDPNFALSEATFQRLPRQGWVVGLAVRDGDVELAKALQAATNDMASSGELAQIFAKHGVSLAKP